MRFYVCTGFLFYGRFFNISLQLLLQQISIAEAAGQRLLKAAGTEVISERQGVMFSLGWNCACGCAHKEPGKEQSCYQLHNPDIDINK